MTDQTLQPIETVYRCYRFRSRLEARYAVYFGAAGIRWQYEVEGYVVAGRRYLPDFWLTELKCFAEVRSDAERAKEALPLLQALSTASGHPAILLTGDFLDANHADAFMPWAMKDDAPTVAIVTAKPTVAWKLFGQWQRREAEEAACAPDDDDD